MILFRAEIGFKYLILECLWLGNLPFLCHLKGQNFAMWEHKPQIKQRGAPIFGSYLHCFMSCGP